MCFRIKLLPRGLVQVLLIGLFAGCWTEYSPTEAHAAETPVIKGIVLIADQAQLRKIDGNTSAKTFLDTTATPWIDAAKLGEKLTPFQDRELDKLSADLVVAAITNYHKDVLDEPFVNVYTPPRRRSPPAYCRSSSSVASLAASPSKAKSGTQRNPICGTSRSSLDSRSRCRA